MKLAHLDLGKYPLLLAPMEDVTDLPFRMVCREFGADMVYTEFVSADALIRNVNRTMKKITLQETERPVGIQVYGRDPEDVAEAARISEQENPDLIDINFGCPVKRVATKGAGSGLLKDIPRLLEITKAVVDAVKVPVTVKTRLGWDEDSKIIVDLAEAIQDCGAQALTIHGRTRNQMFKGEADWTLIGEVKNNPRMKIPIIGNGDIDSGEMTKTYFDRYGVDAIMIGRAAIGKPWIFQEIKHYLEHGENPEPLSFDDQVTILKQIVKNSIDWLDERRGVLHSRRHLATSPAFKGIPNFKDTRIAMLQAAKPVDLFEIMDRAVEIYHESVVL